MPEMKTLNGYEVVDAKARQDIKGIQAAVEAIPEYDLTPYATKSELPTRVSQLQNDSRFITLEEVPETDLSEYAKKSELPTVPKKVSELTNDAGYITAAEVPKTDLSAYAKKTDIPDVSGFITSIPSEYVTESELNAKGYLTQHQDISHLAPKTSIPTKVSQLANDSNYLTSIPSNYITEAELEAKGYLTEHQSLAAYATKTYVDNTVAENQPNLSGYAKKTDIPDVSGFISEIPSEYVTDSELATKGYLVEADLGEYAKKSEIPTVPTKTSQLTNDSNFLTAIPSEYITETELDNKGYLTQHQSLEGYATKTYVDDAVAGIDIPNVEPTTFFLDFSTATSVDQAATEAMVAFANYFKNNDNVSVYMRDSFDSDFYYPAVIQKVGTYTFNFLKASVNLNNVASNGALNWDVIRIYSNDNGATWKFTKLATSSTTIATKEYVDEQVNDCKDVFFLDFSNATTSYLPADKQMKDFGERFFVMGKDDISVMIKDTQSNYFYPAVMDRQLEHSRILFTPLAINLNSINGTTPCTWDVISLDRLNIGGQYEWRYCLLSQGASTTIATKSYVDAAISALRAELGGTK